MWEVGCEGWGVEVGYRGEVWKVGCGRWGVVGGGM